MTLSDFQKGALALFAARAAGPGAALEQMKAICYCIRNRVRAGWYDGQWLTVMEHAGETLANPLDTFFVDPTVRSLQRLIADVDDIYYGGASQNRNMRNDQTPTAQKFAAETFDLEGAIGKSCYWHFLNKPIYAWFRENIIEKPEEHPRKTR